MTTFYHANLANLEAVEIFDFFVSLVPWSVENRVTFDSVIDICLL